MSEGTAKLKKIHDKDGPINPMEGIGVLRGWRAEEGWKLEVIT
jgi:hypothetical protein